MPAMIWLKNSAGTRCQKAAIVSTVSIKENAFCKHPKKTGSLNYNLSCKFRMIIVPVKNQIKKQGPVLDLKRLVWN
jgi:hypothetical protein